MFEMRRMRRMTEQEARRIVEQLTYEEKLKLNEMLKDLERKRQPYPSQLELIEQGA